MDKCQIDRNGMLTGARSCPFCGSSELWFHIYGYVCFIECVKCHMQGPTTENIRPIEKAQQRAVRKWNRRVSAGSEVDDG